MRGAAALVLAMALCAAPVQAQDLTLLDGDWALGDPTACNLDRSAHFNAFLSIRSGVLESHWAECRFLEPAPVDGTEAIVARHVCHYADGAVIDTGAVVLMVDANGNLLTTFNGVARVLAPCSGFVQP
jgi:hypothetical protein